MALQSSGQITASDIMAEWSYPASTQWKVSVDGAGFISFAVSSIIKYSDFYNGSAESGARYGFAMGSTAGTSGQVSLGGGLQTTRINMRKSAADTEITPTHGSMGFSVSRANIDETCRQSTWFEIETKVATSTQRGSLITWTLPVSATSGVNYECWSPYVMIGQVSPRNNLNNGFRGSGNVFWRLTAGTYDMWWGYSNDSTVKNSIGTNGGRNTSSGGGGISQVYGNDTYIGMPNQYSGFSNQGGICYQTSGPVFHNIPGAQIASSGTVTIRRYASCNDDLSGAATATTSQADGQTLFNPVTSTGATQGNILTGTFNRGTKMSGWTGANDPGSLNSVYGTSSPTARPGWDIVEAGTY
jgi:hypothetical protein